LRGSGIRRPEDRDAPVLAKVLKIVEALKSVRVAGEVLGSGAEGNGKGEG
jgi:hypothetical protein